MEKWTAPLVWQDDGGISTFGRFESRGLNLSGMVNKNRVVSVGVDVSAVGLNTSSASVRANR